MFRKAVVEYTRFGLDNRVHGFIRALLDTAKRRTIHLKKDSLLFRAQLGCEMTSMSNAFGVHVSGTNLPLIPQAFAADRMKPLPDAAREGRANPKGIPCLYLSDDRETAMSETRPWLGSYISVATLAIKTDTTLVEFCTPIPDVDFGALTTNKWTPTRDEIENYVWGSISNAFSEPVTTTEHTAEYAPTQLIADGLRSAGFDGIKYKSLVGQGQNYALFDLFSPEVKDRQLFVSKQIGHKFEAFDPHCFLERK